MKRIGTTTLAFVLACLVILAYLFFRPGASFAPAKMNRIFHPDERVEHHRGMDKVFPSRPIAASSTPFKFETAKADLPGTYEFNGEQRKITDFFQKSTTTSLVVLRQGKLESESYFTGATAESRFTSWSIAKSLVATLIGMSVHAGKIASLDDKASKYVPELSGKAYGDASLRSLLQMASGVRFNEDYVDKLSDINKLFFKVFIFGQGVNESIANHPFEVAPGTRFSYVSADTQVLSWVLRKAHGKPVAEIAQEYIWQPLGMEASAYWSVDRSIDSDADRVAASELGYCCLNATARDYAKLGQLYLQDGQWQGKRLLPEGWVRQVSRPSAAWQEPGYLDPKSPSGRNDTRGYGMHFWVPKGYDGEYFANGVWGQSIWVSEKPGVVIVRTAVDPEYRANLSEMFAVMRAIAGKKP